MSCKGTADICTLKGCNEVQRLQVMTNAHWPTYCTKTCGVVSVIRDRGRRETYNTTDPCWNPSYYYYLYEGTVKWCQIRL